MMKTTETYWDDAREPGVTFMAIRAATRDAVQYRITRAMDLIEARGGWAYFEGPRRMGDGFVAKGAISK